MQWHKSLRLSYYHLHCMILQVDPYQPNLFAGKIYFQGGPLKTCLSLSLKKLVIVLSKPQKELEGEIEIRKMHASSRLKKIQCIEHHILQYLASLIICFRQVTQIYSKVNVPFTDPPYILHPLISYVRVSQKISPIGLVQP